MKFTSRCRVGREQARQIPGGRVSYVEWTANTKATEDSKGLAWAGGVSKSRVLGERSERKRGASGTFWPFERTEWRHNVICHKNLLTATLRLE